MPETTEVVLTREQLENMRAILAQHDRKTGIVVVDLNKPPQEPYQYRPFPRALYRVVKDKDEFEAKRKPGYAILTQHESGFPKVICAPVQDQDALDKSLEDGWTKDPPKLEPADQKHHAAPTHHSELDAESAAEAAEVDRKLREKPKGK